MDVGNCLNWDLWDYRICGIFLILMRKTVGIRICRIKGLAGLKDIQDCF